MHRYQNKVLLNTNLPLQDTSTSVFQFKKKCPSTHKTGQWSHRHTKKYYVCNGSDTRSTKPLQQQDSSQFFLQTIFGNPHKQQTSSLIEPTTAADVSPVTYKQPAASMLSGQFFPKVNCVVPTTKNSTNTMFPTTA